MPLRLVAIDEGPDIPIDRAMVIVGRHPQCDARLDSIRVSRRHCCMTPEEGGLIVRDLGSTNGIRINGQRVEEGHLRVGGELSIAHIRYRLDNGLAQERTMAATLGPSAPGVWRDDSNQSPVNALDDPRNGHGAEKAAPVGAGGELAARYGTTEDSGENNPLALAVRELIPRNLADKCHIQVIIKMDQEHASAGLAQGEPKPASCPDSPP
jgi:predicted component of type VI protein secretion system